MLNGTVFQKSIALVLIALFLFSSNVYAQQSTEKVLFSFQTTNRKQCRLTLDTLSQTMIYRFGTSKATEWEVVDDLKDLDTIFTYVYYFRGGGKQNCGLDLNTISFQVSDVKYTLYDHYSAESGKSWIGFEYEQLSTGASEIMRGKFSTRKGTLVDFRFNNMLPIIWDSNL